MKFVMKKKQRNKYGKSHIYKVRPVIRSFTMPTFHDNFLKIDFRTLNKRTLNLGKLYFFTKQVYGTACTCPNNSKIYDTHSVSTFTQNTSHNVHS